MDRNRESGKMKKKYEMDMCSGSVLQKMLLFALPLMCSGVLQLLFNAADIIVVGRYAGDNSLAAVGANTALINLFTNLFIGLSVGANVIAAQEFGAKKDTELQKTVHTSMLLGLYSGILLAVLGICLTGRILVLMQTPGEILGLASLYLKIFFLGMPASMVYNFGSALLRSVGDTRRPLYYLLTAGVINVILNLIFVISLQMDVAGVALATIISQYISAVLVVRCLMLEKSAIQLKMSEVQFDFKKFRSILQIGLPAGFQGIVFSLSNVVIQSSVNLFGEIVVAGNSAASNLEGFVYIAMNSFYQAALSFTSQNYGAGKRDRIRRILFCAEGCVIVTGLSLGWLSYLFGESLLRIYSSNVQVIEAGMVRMAIIMTTYALCGMMDVMVGMLRGLGYSFMPMVVSLIGACGLRLVWIATVFRIPSFHTVSTVYLSYPITWIITFLVHVICYYIVARKAIARIASRQ